jgi:MFS family permease
MTMTNALLFGILPAGLLVWIGNLIRTPTTIKKGKIRELLLLSGILALLLITLAVAISVNEPTTYPLQVLFFLLMALLPAMCGTLAALFLHIFSDRITRSHYTVRILAVFLTAFALVVTGIAAAVLTIPGFILFGPLLIAVVWQLWGWAGKWYPVLYALQVILLGITVVATDSPFSVSEAPFWLASFTHVLLYFLIPATAIVVAARLFLPSPTDSPSIYWRRVLLSLLLGAPLLFLVGYQIMLVSMWDVATDGLGGPFLWLWVSVTGIAAAMVLAWFSPGLRRLIALAFAITVPLSMLYAQDIGTYGPTGRWGMMPTVVTEQRAETVNQAIHSYYARNGRYPPALNDLMPWYLVYVSPPLIIPGKTWCYEGGPDYYRLGYVYRDFFLRRQP